MTSFSTSFDSPPGSPYKVRRAAISAAYTQEDSAPLEGDALADWLATKDGVKMVSSLSREAKSIRDEISGIEEQMAGVESPSLRGAARQRVNELRGSLFRIVAKATHGRYTPEDVQCWAEHSVRKGGRFPIIDTKVIKDLVYIRRVPNGPIRGALLDHLEAGEDRSYTDVVRTAQERLVELEAEMGVDLRSSAWATDTPEQSAQAIQSMQTQLGMNAAQSRRGAFCTMFIPYERAVALSRAIGMNPQEAGV